MADKAGRVDGDDTAVAIPHSKPAQKTVYIANMGCNPTIAAFLRRYLPCLFERLEEDHPFRQKILSKGVDSLKVG